MHRCINHAKRFSQCKPFLSWIAGPLFTLQGRQTVIDCEQAVGLRLIWRQRINGPCFCALGLLRSHKPEVVPEALIYWLRGRIAAHLGHSIAASVVRGGSKVRLSKDKSRLCAPGLHFIPLAE